MSNLTLGELSSWRQPIIVNKTKEPNCRDKPRFFHWRDDAGYKCIRGGKRVFRDIYHIIEVADTLEENDLEHYEHQDPNVRRFDKYVTRYRAFFRLENGTLVRPQQSHFVQMYLRCGRLDAEQATFILLDGTPYWTDIYAKRVLNARGRKRKK